ncbi:MAG: N-acetylneuraminate synthase family protein [Candidatus Niyogibacteria bacterium]|nr:N-acetylneuraminate synthase family protein [Candidatus Niyogibacteria bacterium]
MKKIKIGNISISQNGPLFFIADIAANHDGDINRAYKLIELAKESGAHAAKFQNFQADKIVSKSGFESLNRKMSHQASWKKSVYETYKDASIPFDWTKKLKKKCDEVGLEYFTSPYDFESVDKVEPFVSVYKIGSGDITWLDIIEYIAKKKKPVIISTGASSIEDVKRAMNTLKKHVNDIILLQCNTNYTASAENFKYINLNVLKSFKQEYPDIILGLSDHTSSHSTVLGAIALGATVFEKHFTDDNNRDGPDHKFAMNPKTWREMIDRANELFLALRNDGLKIVEENEKESVILQRRAIRAKFDLKAGSILDYNDFDFLRPIPEGGLPPYKAPEIIGKKIMKDIKKGELISLNDFI